MTTEDLIFLYKLEEYIATLQASLRADGEDCVDYMVAEDLSNLVESMIKELEGVGT